MEVYFRNIFFWHNSTNMFSAKVNSKQNTEMLIHDLLYKWHLKYYMFGNKQNEE